MMTTGTKRAKDLSSLQNSLYGQHPWFVCGHYLGKKSGRKWVCGIIMESAIPIATHLLSAFLWMARRDIIVKIKGSKRNRGGIFLFDLYMLYS